MKLIQIFAVLALFSSCNNATKDSKEPIDTANYELVLASDVEWTHLNPKRGDLAPKAGTLWGDRKGTEATGFLLKPNDGFSSPPHIHNVSYRGVVISGVLHNDDPEAAKMWMPAGSFWTQPKGEVHITAAEGNYTLAYIEIEEGPYLVLPEEEHFDSGERPVNVEESNLVWLNAADIEWVQSETNTNNTAQVTFLWDEAVSDLNGSLIKLPAGFKGKVISAGESFKAVVINGELGYSSKTQTSEKLLSPGSYFASTGGGVHQLSNNTNAEVLIYIRSKGKYRVVSVK